MSADHASGPHSGVRPVYGSEKLESNLSRLRNNLSTLEDNLHLFQLQNNAEIKQQTFDTRLVNERKQELDQMKSRINALLRTEKDRIRELHDAVAAAKESMRAASEKRQIKKQKRKATKTAQMEAHLHKFKVQSQRQNDQISLVEARQGLWDYNRLSQMEAKKDDARQQAKQRQLELQGKIKNMQGVIKAKMIELAMAQANKNQQLNRRVDVSKRLKKKRLQNKEEFAKANVLMSYSLDVEQAIKANIEMASQLKDYYERACSAIKKGHDVDFEEEPEIVAEQLGVKFHQVALPTDIRLPGKAQKLEPMAGLFNSPSKVFAQKKETFEFDEDPPPLIRRNFDSKSTDRKNKGILGKSPGLRVSKKSNRLPKRNAQEQPAQEIFDLNLEDITIGDTWGVRIEKKPDPSKADRKAEPYQDTAEQQSPLRGAKPDSKLADRVEEESRYNHIDSHMSHEESHPVQKFYMRGSDGFERSRAKKRRSSAHE